jgi:hypothetical protein
MILNDGNDWEPNTETVLKWKEKFKGTGVNVERELVKMDLWCDANPTKRKTPKGIKSFCTRWLLNAEKQNGQSIELQKHQEKEFDRRLKKRQSSIRERTLDESMCDITWMEGDQHLMMKQYYLDKFGCYFDGEMHYAS